MLSLLKIFPLIGLVTAAYTPLVPRQNLSTSGISSAISSATEVSNATSSASGTSESNATSTGTTVVPTVTMYPKNSTVSSVEIAGIRQQSYGQDTYLGIPFAKPPVGDLRFEYPASYSYNTTSYEALTQPPACMQAASSTHSSTSEDCLYLNVFTPLGSDNTTSLPVMVWVYGGSFISGAASIYNASLTVAYGIETDRPFVFVALNYRLGAFGWGTGSGYAENNATNLGLRDIRKALSWVQENIAAFGGDPDQVTVFGESAGSIAISLLYMDPEVDLFKSAIMESGSQSTSPIGPANSTWEDAYEALLLATNCSSPSNSSLSPFQCLKELPAADLLQGQVTVRSQVAFEAGFVFGPVVDGDLIPDSTHALLSEGKFAKKPFITGCNKDEGTSFVPTTLNSTAAVAAYVDLLEPQDPSAATLAKLLTVYYPNIPALGSPFDTGNETFGLGSAFKQAAAAIGDGQFQAPRRYFIRQSNVHGNNQTWTYQFEQPTPGADAYLGIYHSSEIPYVYGAARPGVGLAQYSTNYTEADAVLSNTIMNYWINFAYYTDPNGAANATTNVTHWSPHNISKNKNILRLKADNITVFQDDYREEQMDFFLANPEQFNAKRDV